MSDWRYMRDEPLPMYGLVWVAVHSAKDWVIVECCEPGLSGYIRDNPDTYYAWAPYYLFNSRTVKAPKYIK